MKAKKKTTVRRRKTIRRREAASTNEILNAGAPPNGSAVAVAPKWAWHFRALLKLRERLREERTALAREAAEPIMPRNMDMADSATDEFDHDMALTELAAEQDALYEVEEALRRICDNTYGICEATGKPIPARRLKAVPWTRFTAQARLSLERQGATDRPHLSKLISIRAAARPPSSVSSEEPETDQSKPEPFP